MQSWLMTNEPVPLFSVTLIAPHLAIWLPLWFLVLFLHQHGRIYLTSPFFFTFFSFLYSFLFPTPFFISWCFFQLFPLAFFHLLILYQSLSLLEPTHKIHIHHPSVNFDLLLCKRNINWRRFPCGAIVTAQYRGHLATLGSSFDWKPKIH